MQVLEWSNSLQVVSNEVIVFASTIKTMNRLKMYLRENRFALKLMEFLKLLTDGFGQPSFFLKDRRNKRVRTKIWRFLYLTTFWS